MGNRNRHQQLKTVRRFYIRFSITCKRVVEPFEIFSRFFFRNARTILASHASSNILCAWGARFRLRPIEAGRGPNTLLIYLHSRPICLIHRIKSRIPYSVSRIPCPVPRIPYPVSRIPCPVPRIPYPASRIPYPVSRAPYPVSRIPYPVPRTPYPVSRIL